MPGRSRSARSDRSRRAGSAIDAADLPAHTSTWTEPIATDYRGVRVTTHPPNSSGFVALELLNILERFEPPPAAAFGPDGIGADLRWIHLGIEASKLAMADRDAHLTDPDVPDMPLDHLLDPAYAAELAARIDPRRALRPPAATVPARRRDGLARAVDGDGNAVSLIESNYMGFGSGVVDPETGIHYQNRGSYFSLDPEHPNVLAPGKRTLHTLLPGMLFREGERPWVVIGSMGGDAQPQIHAQVVSALVDGGVDVATAVGVPRWFVEPDEHFAPPIDVRARAALPGRASSRARGARPPGRARRRRSTARSATAHAIELVDGGPAAGGLAGGGHRPAQRRSARGLVTSPAAGAGALVSAATPSGGRHRERTSPILRPTGGGCAHDDAATGTPSVVREAIRDLERRSELPVHERDRGGPGARRSRGLVGASRGLAAKLAAESTPLDANERWWVWKCPTKGCPGLLHVAGYAVEKHAVYVVCDGTCGKTFLR